MFLDRSLPTARVRADRLADGADVCVQKRGVLAVGGLIEVPSDPYGTAPLIERRLDQVGDLGLPGTGRAADDDDDRLLLRHGVLRGRREDQPFQHLAVFRLGQHA